MPVDNSTYNRIITEYEIRQRQRERLIDERRRQLYDSIPEYRDADFQIADGAKLHLKRLLSPDCSEDDRSSYHELIESMKEKKLSLLISNGFPADYLEPPYECPDCRDTGYIGTSPCHCLSQRLLNALYDQHPQMRVLENANLDDFSLDYYPADTFDTITSVSSRVAASKALEDANTFISDFSARRGNLLIYGDTGAGKTFLSSCIGNALRKKGYTVIYQSAGAFFDSVSAHVFRRESGHAASLYKNIKNADLLIIDDLGTELTNSFTNTAVFDIINDRIISGQSTIISTNLSLQEIFDIYTGRVFSRLTENYALLHLFGTDVRLLKSSGDRLETK